MQDNLKPNYLIPLLFCLFAFSSCYENQEGCTDIRAVNYDLDADNACGGCCEFPSLRIRPSHQRSFADTTVSLDLDSIFFDDFGQPYRIENIRFLMSDFALIRTDGTEATTTDTINLQTYPNDESVTITDDMVLVNANLSRSIDVGGWPATGTFDQISCLFGLDQTTNSVIPNSAPTDHPLNLEDESLFLNLVDGYAMAQISLFQDTTEADSIPIEFSLRFPDASVPFLLDLPISYTAIEGFSTRVDVAIDYAALFSGVNITADTLFIQEKMTANLPQVISITNIVAESQ